MEKTTGGEIHSNMLKRNRFISRLIQLLTISIHADAIITFISNLSDFEAR